MFFDFVFFVDNLDYLNDLLLDIFDFCLVVEIVVESKYDNLFLFG